MIEHIIIVVHVDARAKNAVPVQQALTEYGHIIDTRLGLHPSTPGEEGCGLIVVHFRPHMKTEIATLEAKLKAMAGVSVERVSFGGEKAGPSPPKKAKK